MPIHRKVFVLLGWVILLVGPALAQQEMKSLERQLTQVQAAQDSLAQRMAELKRQADSLATRIADIRSREPLGFVERRRLDGLLKKSQELTARQEAALERRTELERQSQSLRVRLRKLYDARIDSIMSRLDRPQGVSRVERERLGLEIRLLRAKRAALDTPEARRLVSPSSENPDFEQTAMPQNIEARAVFFRDREDRYRAKAMELEARIARVREETRLRKRLAEMVDDVRLFDSRDEAVRPEKSATRVATQDFAEAGKRGFDSWSNADYMIGIGNTLAIKRADQLLSLDFWTLPAYDIGDYLRDLDAEKKRLLAAADSLAALAKEYEQKAQQLRQSVESQPE